MNTCVMAALQHHMNFKGGQVRLLFRDLERILELFGALQSTKEYNKTIRNSISQ
jgi:hypothetical protein